MIARTCKSDLFHNFTTLKTFETDVFIIISKSDKGWEAAKMKRSDYVNKINSNLADNQIRTNKKRSLKTIF